MNPEHFIEHPEGGRYQEVFRSSARVVNDTGKQRSALTHIYFALDGDERSRFHRVASDEVWNLYRGVGLYLYVWDGSASRPDRIELSVDTNQFCHVVPAGTWQAAEPKQGGVLVGCSVGPGFEFDDFTLMTPNSVEAVRLQNLDPTLGRLVIP
ncbi:MAG: hypothetical protein COV99_05195 [Bacteroidetes bacterium CG12_big_fil_rev_8_21_14_0_65_60_17]|nr:MAG: hypothetical protein COV99_05195 [Bacteroidetes bacterium CG12_big_fil_rev_8_21_14_0_65_60_17]